MIKIRLCKKIGAFTLSEVLITLGIIGVIAAITVPNLIQKQREATTVSQLKKVYSTLSSAYALAVEENGTPDNWELGDMNNITGMDNLNRIMSKYLSVQKNCGRGDGCFPIAKYKDLNGVDVSASYYSDGKTKMVLADGTLLRMYQWNGDCSWNWGDTPALKSVCGPFSVDLNGAKGPNQYAYDYFGFVFTKYGIVPLGTAAQSMAYPYDRYCDLSETSGGGWTNGFSCTAWVIYNGNMDYTKPCSSTLSWTGKTSCD